MRPGCSSAPRTSAPSPPACPPCFKSWASSACASNDGAATGTPAERPFVDPVHFDPLTVCSPGVHDASSLRGWWEESEDERALYWRQALGREGSPPDRLDTETLAAILARNLDAASRVCVLSMPDCLALDPALRSDDPREERINTPGSESLLNWDWRMPVAVEELAGRVEWTRRLTVLVARRSERAL